MKSLLITIFVLCGICSQLFAGSNKNSEKAGSEMEWVETLPAFEFRMLVDFDIPENLETSTSLWSINVCRKQQVIRTTYLQQFDVEVGFNATDVDVAKPAVYNSVERIERFLRKSVKSGRMTQIEAEREYLHVLDCAYAVFYNNETAAFEKALVRARQPEVLLAVFRKVKVVD